MSIEYVNAPLIESMFNDPQNMDRVYVYEIVNFNEKLDTIISSNTNNFLKLKFLKELKGIIHSINFNPHLKIMSNEQNINLNVLTDYIFVTNDNCFFLENTKKIYVFTIHLPFLKNHSEIYFIAPGSLVTKSNNSEFSLDELKEDDDIYNNLFSLGLQNIKKLEFGENNFLEFDLFDSIPKFEKINSISYEIPVNSFYQTIQIIGTIRNDILNLEIQNEKLDLELTSKNGIVPVIANLTNLNQKAEINIFNLAIINQLPLTFLESIIKNDSDIIDIFNFFLSDDGELPIYIKKIQLLLKKIIIISHMYNTDFSIFKKEKKFLEVFNAVYSGKTALDYNTNLIYKFQIENKSAVETMAFKVFKAICFMLSEFIPTPFAYQKGYNSDFKYKTWYWLNIEIFAKNMYDFNLNDKGLFNNDNLIEYPKINCNVDSKFFNIVKKNDIIISNKIKNFSIIENSISSYLPPKKITEIKNNSENVDYLTYIFFKNNQLSSDFIKNFSISSTTTEKIFSVNSERDDRFLSDKELKQLLPPGAFDYNFLLINREIKDANKPGDCRYDWEEAKGYNKIKYKHSYHTDTECFYIVQFFDVETDHNGVPRNERYLYSESKILPRPQVLVTKFWTHGEIFYKTNINIIEDNFSYSSSQILQYLSEKNGNNLNLNIKFELSKKLKDQGWYIKSIKEDYHYSLLNSAKKIIINYNTKDEQNLEFVYNINNSFQKNDNTNVLTKNRY